MRIFMIGWIAALGCSAALATPATSKAANGRGMNLMAKKKWTAAEAEFKTAVAEDPNSVKAHYNLASAASRAHDRDTALSEIIWVLDRATWDDNAKPAAKKVDSDDDLLWALRDWEVAGLQWVGGDAKPALIDLVQPPYAPNNGGGIADPTRAAGLRAAPGAHDAKCSASDAKQGKVLEVPYKQSDKIVGKVSSVVASLRDGVALVDANGAVLARSEPLGCTGLGESQDQLATLSYGDGEPLPSGIDNVPTVDLQLFAVSYTNGGRREWETRVVVFATHGKVLAKVFEATLASSDTTGAGHLWQSPIGHLIYSGPGETKKHPFRWDPAAFKFVAM